MMCFGFLFSRSSSLVFYMESVNREESRRIITSLSDNLQDLNVRARLMSNKTTRERRNYDILLNILIIQAVLLDFKLETASKKTTVKGTVACAGILTFEKD